MPLTYVPLLGVQRDLYRIPRGRERFEQYLQTMIDASTGDIRFPLVAMNPMAKEHVPALLDRLIELGADNIGGAATREIDDIGRDLRVTTVVSDDLIGGWTHRFAAEFSSRFETKPLLERGWIVAMLWSSETPAVDRVQQSVAAAIRRVEFILKHGFASTLAERMSQEGYALASAGVEMPDVDLEHLRAVIAPLLQATDMRTAIECLFGDVGARSLGFTERGLPENAGLALALAEEKGRVSAAS